MCALFSSYPTKAWISVTMSDLLESLFAHTGYWILMSLPYLWETSTKIPEPQMDSKLSVWNSENTLILSYSQNLKKTVSEVAILFLVTE